MKDNKEPENKIQYMPIFMCLGMSVGMAIGVAAGNMSVGMCLGLSIGMCLGVSLDSLNKKKSDTDSCSTENEKEESEI